MTGAAPYITRRAINATEEALDEDSSLDGAARTTAYGWEAELDGYLSTGEHVRMTRSGGTFAEAVASLEAAIVENGWIIREKGTR